MDLTKYKAKENKTIREHTDDLKENANILFNYNYIDKDTLTILLEICEYHDYGKANIKFRDRIEASIEKNRLIKNGIEIPKNILEKSKFNDKFEIGHNVLSIFFIDPSKYAEDEYYLISKCVLHHHNHCDNCDVLMDKEKNKLIKEILSEFEDFIFKVSKDTKNELYLYKEDLKQNYILGLLYRCDYSASGNTQIEYPNDFLDLKMESLIKKMKYNWNEMQIYAKENTNENIILIAQTGMGKTEAGLRWIGDNKGFFILPLRTAINAIYKRIREDVLENENIENRLSILHSDSLSEYYKIKDSLEKDIFDYYSQSKSLSMPLNVSTLDQLFKFVFKYTGFQSIMSTLAYSKLVIDEIQVYDSALLAYLIYGINILDKLGCKIAILTATFPPFIQNIIDSETEINFKKKKFINDNIKRHNLKIINSKLDLELIINTYKNCDRENGKVLIVCNSVKFAREVYKNLVDLNIENVNLLHSKFIKNDRSKKEDSILEDGKTDVKRKVIWISTQIVEASLDIDFDFIFTELSELNGLFQRLGRCNRKGKKLIDKTNCFVFTEINAGLIKISKNSKGFIDKDMYNLSKEALKTLGDGCILRESKKLELIDNTFSFENLKNSNYIESFKECYEYIKALEIGERDKKDVQIIFRNIESESVIPLPVYNENKEKIDNLVSEIKNEKMEKLKRLILKNKLMGFTVQAQLYETYNPIKELNLGNSIIKVIESFYDDSGFYINKSNDYEQPS